jgi:hypothetical protein
MTLVRRRSRFHARELSSLPATLIQLCEAGG